MVEKISYNVGLSWKFHEFESFICKAFRDAVVLMLPQVPDNEANGRLGLARLVGAPCPVVARRAKPEKGEKIENKKPISFDNVWFKYQESETAPKFL